MTKNSSDPFGTLSIGNVVTTGTILYRSNLKRYLQVSLRATAWVVAIFAAAIGLMLIGGVLFSLTQSWLPVVIPLVVVWFGLSLYLSAKSLTDRAVICRLAYQELIDAPETVDAATRQLLPRTWAFLRLSLLLGLYLSLLVIVGYILFAIAIGLMVALLMSVAQLSPDNGVFVVFIILLSVVFFVLLVALIVRFYAAWFVAELPLAVEPITSANFSIRRSRQLSNNVIGKLVLIITVAFLITIPLSSIGSTPSFIGQLMSVSSTDSAKVVGGVLTIVGFFVSLAIELLIMPFWQIIKAIVYFDLRNRQEGNDLII
ncbi:hypothetical protein [Chamaesiphon sp. VAR_48_metabat_403]|uniref:hypothetical protein n=1 Tax=Chamaesiphon sp. VAR_48_metabat_403 TaxID=2964700 RepID=UPI00286E0153|nr:hypothetical protein [Chamaesiphon sp. VAR_48_metabat_403]